MGCRVLKSLTVNGTPVVVQSGSFSYALTLSDGANEIRTVATDNAGNAITDTRTVTLDTTAPETLANPLGGDVRNGPERNIDGERGRDDLLYAGRDGADDGIIGVRDPDSGDVVADIEVFCEGFGGECGNGQEPGLYAGVSVDGNPFRVWGAER